MASIPSSLQPALVRYGERLRRRFGPRLREMRLFGSYARGEAHEDSDVDVLVVVDGLTDLEIGAAAGDAAEIAMETGTPLAPLPIATERMSELRRSERLLARVLDEEGVVL